MAPALPAPSATISDYDDDHGRCPWPIPPMDGPYIMPQVQGHDPTMFLCRSPTRTDDDLSRRHNELEETRLVKFRIPELNFYWNLLNTSKPKNCSGNLAGRSRKPSRSDSRFSHDLEGLYRGDIADIARYRRYRTISRHITVVTAGPQRL